MGLIVLSSDSRPMENTKPSIVYVFLSLVRLGRSAAVSSDHWLTATADLATAATSAGPQRLRSSLYHLLL